MAFNILPAENEISDVHLEQREVYRMEDIAPLTTIVCQKGIIWLTQTGDGNDHVLEVGEKFTLRHPGLVLMEALPDALVRIIPPSQN